MNMRKTTCLALLLAWASPAAVRAQDAGTPDAGTEALTEADAEAGVEAPAEPGDEGPEAEAAPHVPPPPEPPAPPPVAPVPPPRAVPDPPDLVEPCSARAREAAVDAVVRVRSGRTWGAGFVYHSRRHVVTAFSLVRLGQGASVVTHDDVRHEAHIVARDEALDLVILELDEPLDVTPLEPAPETSAMIGRPAVALGHPFDGAAAVLGDRGAGLLRWSVVQGQVAAVNDAAIQADVALAAGHAGAPLLDCEGRVLGMITGAGILGTDVGLVVRASRIDATIDGAGVPGDYIGELRPQLGLGGAMYVDESGSVALGLYVTLGATLFDRVSLMNRVGLFFGGVDSPTGDVLSRDRQLIRIESLLGYRFFIDVFGFTTLYIVPAGGIAVLHDRLSERTAMVTPGCMPGADMSCITFEEVTTENWLVRPAFGLSFLFGGSIEIGYTIELGVDTDPLRTFHVVRLGAIF
ncbi:MAG: trypsin-like peptidase domain-containing protein [Sandaracinaceae bacterium]|nr:trypsin-like peptidase domain-containing protein [Sandaracinaceae bacterium]